MIILRKKYFLKEKKKHKSKSQWKILILNYQKLKKVYLKILGLQKKIF